MVDPALSHRKANSVQVASVSSWGQKVPQMGNDKQVDIFHTILGGEGWL